MAMTKNWIKTSKIGHDQIFASKTQKMKITRNRPCPKKRRKNDALKDHGQWGSIHSLSTRDAVINTILGCVVVSTVASLGKSSKKGKRNAISNLLEPECFLDHKNE